MKANLITIFVGLLIAIVSWVPLWIIQARDPQSIPFTLGLVTFAVSFVGDLIALVGVIRLLIYAVRASKTRP
jgi:hypothetical protein